MNGSTIIENVEQSDSRELTTAMMGHHNSDKSCETPFICPSFIPFNEGIDHKYTGMSGKFLIFKKNSFSWSSVKNGSIKHRYSAVVLSLRRNKYAEHIKEGSIISFTSTSQIQKGWKKCGIELKLFSKYDINIQIVPRSNALPLLWAHRCYKMKYLGNC